MTSITAMHRGFGWHRLVAIVVAVTLIAGACGDSGPARDPIGVKSVSVQGERLFIDDLAETDTVLWFWAPW